MTRKLKVRILKYKIIAKILNFFFTKNMIKKSIHVQFKTEVSISSFEKLFKNSLFLDSARHKSLIEKL